MASEGAEQFQMENLENNTETARLTTSGTEQIVLNATMPKLESMYFTDGVRRIDYILAYEVGIEKEDKEAKKHAKRMEFQRNLCEQNLDLEVEPAENSPDGKTVFVKIHAPWEVLTAQAEVLRLKMPIKKMDISRKTTVGDCIDRFLSKLSSPLALDEELVEEQDYFTAVFNRQMEAQFIIEDRDTFFSNVQRSRMVFEILTRLNYDSSQAQRFGINRLLKNATYSAAYPLHEPFISKDQRNDVEKIKKSRRQILYELWAKPTSFYKFQPLDLVRNYFGEKIAIYFAWLGFYTKALLPAALVGLFCLVYGGATMAIDTPSSEICNAQGAENIIMCPVCDSGCFTWNLTQSLIFAACMSIWATLFLEGWKRSQARLAWDWDLADELEEDLIRPEFQIRVKNKERNPITQEWEPYLPFRERACRLVASAVTVFFFMCLVIAFVFGVIVYRVIVEFVLHKHPDEFVRSRAQILTSITGALLNLICIMILDRVYQSLAWKMTKYEFPRTHSQFEDSYTFKVFLFQFINYNSSLFYIAFFKGRFSTVPYTKTNYIFGDYPPEACDPAGCMVELLIQLAIIMVGKQFIGNCMEILFPICFNKWRTCSGKKTSGDGANARWQKDYDLNDIPAMHLFDEYLEMVLQYGFVTLFVAAFPLAPLFALINNIMEIRLDAYKFVVAYRRPMPARAQGLGVWYEILDGISKLAVLTNACVIAFTSDFVPRLVYRIVYSGNNSLNGYIDSELTYYDTSTWCNETGREDICSTPYCRFRDYRNSPCTLNRYNVSDPFCACDESGSYSVCIKWWHVLAARFAFVLVFEHLVFLIKGLVAYLIPDIPRDVRVQIQRENFLAKQAFYKHELTRQSSKPDQKRYSKTGQYSVVDSPTARSRQNRDSEYEYGTPSAGSVAEDEKSSLVSADRSA